MTAYWTDVPCPECNELIQVVFDPGEGEVVYQSGHRNPPTGPYIHAVKGCSCISSEDVSRETYIEKLINYIMEGEGV